MKRAVLVIGHGTRERAGAEEFSAFAAALAPRWPDRIVAPCFLELADPPIIPALDTLITDGVTDVTVAPAFLLGAGHVKNDIPAALDAVRLAHPKVTVRCGAPLGVEPRLLRVLDTRIATQTHLDASTDDTIVLLVGRGASDPDANADVYKIGRLLYEGRAWRSVECAFTSLAHPSIPEGMARCAALGARRVIVAPLFLFTGVLVGRIHAQIREYAPLFPDVEWVVTPHLGGDPLLADLLVQRVGEAEAGTVQMSCDTCLYRAPLVGFEEYAGLARHSDTLHGLRGHSHTHGGFVLPAPVAENAVAGERDKSAPMAAAPMRYASDGSVDWGNMWDSFCALAQKGGPPHRGKLLTAQPDSDPMSASYRSAVAEIIRGIYTVSGLTATAADTGWIAVRCFTEAMARWLHDASAAENLAVRLEGPILFVPVGERFRTAHEIKSVITVVAKTTHYWTEHVHAGTPA